MQNIPEIVRFCFQLHKIFVKNSQLSDFVDDIALIESFFLIFF